MDTNLSNNLPTFTVTVAGKDDTFVSAFADLAAAYHYLDAQQNLSNFERDLLIAARKRSLTKPMIAWLHRRATDRKRIAERFELAEGLQMARLHATLASGTGRLRIGDLKFTFVGGVVWVRKNGELIAKIGADLYLRPFKACEHDDLVRIKIVNEDPIGSAVTHGKTTGDCAFCRRRLTDARSIEVGYGPICAKAQGLPWGQPAEAS